MNKEEGSELRLVKGPGGTMTLQKANPQRGSQSPVESVDIPRILMRYGFAVFVLSSLAAFSVRLWLWALSPL